MAAYGFETPPLPIPKSEIAEVVETEIVVAGAGPSGLAAAVSAAEKGAKVVLLEKFHLISAPGGPGAPFIDSSLQRERAARAEDLPRSNELALLPPSSVPDAASTSLPPLGSPPGPASFGPPSMPNECGPVPTKEEIVEGLWRASAGRADTRLIKLWADSSGEVADWLVSMAREQGIEVSVGRFSHMFSKPGGSPFKLNRTPVGCTQNESELCLLNMMAEKGRRSGVEIRTSTAALRLIRSGAQGRVTGLIAKKVDGSYVQFNASKAIVLCTGDYGMDDEMLDKYCPWAKGLPKLMLDTVTGDGHKMGMWIGAAVEESPHCAMLHFNSTNEKPVVHFRPVGMMNRGSYLYVNKQGERIVNEAGSDEYMANIVLRQAGKTFWQVFDAKSVDDYNRADVEKCTATGAVLRADTIEALAPRFGADPGAFRTTVDRYNDLVNLGKDLDFGKSPELMAMAIDAPPFYVCESPPNLLCVMGGLKRNGSGQVLDTEMRPIQGLYAAGNIAANFWGDTYPMKFLGGISRSHALVFGRLAGLHAAALNTQEGWLCSSAGS